MKLIDVFDSPGFMLGVVESLLLSGALSQDLVTTAIAAGAAPLQELVIEEDGSRTPGDGAAPKIIAAAIAAIGEIEISQAQLDSITEVFFDGGAETYMLIESGAAVALGMEPWELDSGGEAEWFVVTGFGGVDRLANLQTLDLDGYGWSENERDLSPLERLPASVEIIQY